MVCIYIRFLEYCRVGRLHDDVILLQRPESFRGLLSCANYGFCYSKLAGITKFEHERKNEKVLVLVVKCRHRANGLFELPAPGDLSPFSPLHAFPDISCYSLSIPSKKIIWNIILN